MPRHTSSPTHSSRGSSVSSRDSRSTLASLGSLSSSSSRVDPESVQQYVQGSRRPRSFESSRQRATYSPSSPSAKTGNNSRHVSAPRQPGHQYVDSRIPLIRQGWAVW
ncbi:hypothetical protein FA95DRAFT_1564613 [Auriscalpium vulgare]|uniref:Uncharacterized protein n=1 Tax=Auriscalpium vulgare TaxID=40419 RepID=A0ACB8RD73_9AGAM|nr:hypothetical protein FA95DRAFT_1564613 [Auriscalpium vulgare]